MVRFRGFVLYEDHKISTLARKTLHGRKVRAYLGVGDEDSAASWQMRIGRFGELDSGLVAPEESWCRRSLAGGAREATSVRAID